MEARSERIGWKHLGTALVLLIGSMSFGGPADAADRSSDTWKEARIWTSFALNEHLNPFKLDVGVTKGQAQLSGTVQSDVERDLAIEIARSVDGIKDVESEIVVDPSAARSDEQDDGERGFGEAVSDATTAAAIKSQLLWNKHTDGLKVNVDVNRGTAVLEGTADSDAALDLAERIAANTDGVEDVDNRLKIAKAEAEADADTGEQAATAVSDAWVATKVRSVLIWNREVPAHSIDVEVENGEVTLLGNVDNGAQKNLAAELAGNVRGVDEVSNQLSVS